MSDNDQAMSEEDIIRYLRENPDFFCRHEFLLEELVLPHNNRGNAISFMERQVERLRESKISSEHKLTQLNKTARHNELLLERLQKLIVMLIDTDSLEQAMEYLDRALRDDFHADAVELIIFNQSPEVDRSALRPILDRRTSVCGSLTPEQRDILFSEHANEIASAVAIPLCEQNDEPCLGLIAVGSVDPNRYHPDMGTVFVNHLGAVINKIFISHLER